MSKCVERVFKTNSLKPNAASYNNASWYTGTDGFLEHSPSEGNLYYKEPALPMIIPAWVGGGGPSCIIEVKSIFPKTQSH